MMSSKKELAIVSFHLRAKSKNDNSPVVEVLIFTHLAVSLGSCRPALLPFVIIVQGMEYLLRRSGKTGFLVHKIPLFIVLMDGGILWG
jgi:hypothetical protein